MNNSFAKALKAVFAGTLMFVTCTNALADGVVVHGSVYGGGNLADVKTNTTVNMAGGTVAGNVFGGGKGSDYNFTCDKAMVGTEAASNACENPGSDVNKDKGTKVTISNGTIGTLEGEEGSQTLKEGTGNVYGGGEIGRVEWNTQVLIGVGTGEGTFAPTIYGSVFGAGKGLSTHGYSALVRGNSTVTVQGNAKVGYNVYGGGEMSTVGRYWVKDIPADPCDGETKPTAPGDLPSGMPYQQRRGGICTVTIQGSAEIGYQGASDDKGHVFGAGKGVEPSFTADVTNRMVKTDDGGRLETFVDVTDAITGKTKTAEELYLEFLQTLALVTNTDVTINGSAKVKGSVYGGSESGFVQHDTNVKIQGSTCEIGTTNNFGNVFGGGKGLEEFAEAGKVKGNTEVAISAGSINGNVYGGGELGDVGIIDKTDRDNNTGQLTYNYAWKQTDGTTANTAEYNKPSDSSHDTSKNTGICKVIITGGTIGSENGTTANHTSGHVFGAGKGSSTTWWCEKATAFATSVSISEASGSTTKVYGNVYGGGQIGRVEDDAKVVIGTESESDTPDIGGDVFGAGAGIETHGYSALVRGNATVTVQGTTQVGGSVYGGGEIASVGRFSVVGGLPKEPQSGGNCIVTIRDNATIGNENEASTGNVFGACKGVTPAYSNNSSDPNRSKSMQLKTNAPEDPSLWSPYDGDESSPFIWRYYADEADYLAFLRTLALTSNPYVTIGATRTWNESTETESFTPSADSSSETPIVYGSVYGGGQRGITLGSVDVNIVRGIVYQDVYGGGALADTNVGNWDADGYTEVTGLTAESSVTGLYTRTESGGKYTYTEITAENETYDSGTTYYSKGKWADATKMTKKYTTTVDLTGGYIKGDAYGGGLGQKTGFNSASSNIEATVWGDIDVTLDGTKFDITYYGDEGYKDVVKSGRVFGCNNLLGSPQGDVTVTVERTVAGNKSRTTGKVTELVDGEMQEIDKRKSLDPDNHSYELAAVYGGGNLAPYETTGKKAHVIIKGCDLTSILTVYGGGNAAPVPETDVDIHSCYEIGSVFGGGNGKDKYKNDSGWQTNPGANVGTAEQPGNANTMIYGGTVHEAYGASNEQGTIYGNVIIDVADGYPGETPKCPLDVAKLVGAGKNADVNGDLILVMGCKPYEKIPFVYGGADNANVNGDVELTITSGWFGKVFGGNNENGCIMGHIKLNIEETGTCGTPIKIDELYLGGNKAAYSQYGYYYDGTDANGKPILKPRTAAMAAITDPTAEGYTPAITTAQYGSEIRRTAPYDAPELNIISCTYIGEVFGGGLGESAVMYADPTVNINMEPGALAKYIDRDKNGTPDDTSGKLLGTIVDVYGGGNAAAVCGTTTVNIGTETEVQMTSVKDPNTNELLTSQPKHTVTGAYITGNVYGGGKLANVGAYHEVINGTTTTDVVDVEGSTFVNIGAVKGDEILDAQNNGTGRYNYTSVSFAAGAPGIIIGGNVYGGGQGEAAEPVGTDALPGAFRCGKAMVTKNTNVAIGNGTIGDGATDHGHVYGGGEKGRVQENTTVTIGCENDANSAPVITGNVFGAGKGVNTHGYSALTRGNSYVTVQGEAKVKKSVYGGGEIASVGKYNINAQGLPESLANQNSGYCTVIVRDNAVIGPDAAMVMTATGGPDDSGHVFGAGKGVLPYEGYADNVKAWRVTPTNTKQEYLSKNEAIAGTDESGYLPYVETLGLATQTYVTIDENAFVKGSVYGGSENGYVQHNTQVNIRGNCQIGNGYVQMNDDGVYLNKLATPETPMGVNRRYTAAEWEAGYLIPDETNESELYALVHDKYYTSSLPECASWPYGQASGDDKYAPWDKYDGTTNYDSKGGRTTADDGHTFYGNVFGGGSGVIPYRPGKWHPEAGSVGGDAEVNITGGHILTNVYGGNELTDVYGKCTVNFGGTATLGVKRTLKQIAAHPLTCYLFGAGKGDQRVLFNKKTNVEDVEVNVLGGIIYGSVFGGGEDGHVHRDVKMTIGQQTTTEVDNETVTTTSGPTIGTWGTTYVDGNVFGAGRGFGADAYTAGNVAGSVKMEIKGGNILGSVYGGGRLGSVGYGLFDSTDDTGRYGMMRPDDKSDDASNSGTTFYKEGAVGLGRGHIDITISGGTIGNDLEYIIPKTGEGGNTPNTVTETDITKWTTTKGGDWDKWKEYNKIPKTEFDTSTGRLAHTKGGNVFAGGMGNFYRQDGSTLISGVNWWQLGCAKSTKLTITGGNIKSNVYGGGELGQVVGHHTTNNVNLGTEIIIQGSNAIIGSEVKESVTTTTTDENEEEVTSTSEVTRYTFGSVFGGGYGSLMEEITVNNGTSDVTSYPKYIAGRVKAGTKVNMTAGRVWASVYGGGEMAAVGESKTLGETLTSGYSGDTYVTISGGIIGKEKVESTYFGGAKMGNVYGGGSGDNNTVRSGHVYGNTNVTISAGSVSGEPKIYHNVYGGGAYGSVGDFTYQTGTDAQTGTPKVIGIGDLNPDHTNSGVASVTITGGTIGYDGKENGMVFGSSRGDINEPGKRDDHTAWVYNTQVKIGTSGSQTGPAIKGSVYGSGENGHVFNNTVINVYSGTIGIYESTDPGYTVTSNNIEYSGAEYPYRGNVYGGGCGTDKYYSGSIPPGHTYNDGEGDTFNPLAGIVYGTTTVNITGGTVVHNVYGAGAMGSVGRTVTTTNTDNSTTTTYSGGSTTIYVSGGIIGVSGTVGDGNVFGAARGDLSAIGDYISQVRLTNVTVSGGTVKGNVYGGGELGDVGTIDKSDQTDYNYYWTDKDGSANIHGNNGISGTNNNTGICTVTVSGGTIGSDATTMNADGSFDNGNVFGGGKGSGSTWWCEKAIAYGTNVTVTAGTVKGSVYGGGEVGRVEDDAKVTIGSAPNDAPTINGSVFGAGKGLKTHGYSALVRGNAEVTVQGKSVVEGSVYGGGEIASVGKFHVDKGLPVKPMNGGTCKVLIQDEAQIGSSGTGHNVFGACKGVTPVYNNTVNDPNRSKSMQLKRNAPSDNSLWSNYNNDATSPFIWRYYATEADYLDFLKTLALTSNTHVTIDEDATVYGSVFGGGERGVTLGGVDVNITDGTVNEDVYGGGSLADSNVAMWDSKNNQRVTWVSLPELIAGTSATGYYTAESTDALITDPDAVVQSNTSYYANYKTNVNLTGGTVEGNVFGGGLGQLEKAAVNYTEEEAAAYNTEHSLTEDDADYKTTASVKVAAQSAVAAKVYGDVLVKLNETKASTGGCVVKNNIFGCNNLNGSPQSTVTVHIFETADYTGHEKDETKSNTKYNVNAVYGGGNLAAYYPDDATARASAIANVIIDGCDLTSIKTVYGGGNAASVPATEVVVNGTYEIGDVFGGGNGADEYYLDNKKYINPGANVGYKNYTTHTWSDTPAPGQYEVSENSDASTLSGREAYAYGIGKAHATIYGGTVHTVYGGSNSRGNVRVESRTTLEEGGLCTYNVGDAFGGGNNADQDGDAVLEVGCITGLEIAYGGASNADVNGDVILNLTNGTYGQVFGGNNEGGAIRGSIKVNIEETGCNPIVIGELYCGGNEAAYSVYGYNEDGSVKETGSNPVPDPVLNVKSFTSIGKIFGGGYGSRAKMVASPTVNINVVKGRYSNREIAEGEKVYNFDIPSHDAGAIGAIGSVFGGGNAAEVIGTPHVNIGTKVGEVIPLVSKPIEDSEGRTPSAVDWTPSYQLVTVEGVDIRDNVYGAGNNAQVTGDTEVVIGKNNDVKTYSFTSYNAQNDGTAWSSGLAQTTGKYVTSGDNKLAEVEILTNGKYDEYVGKKFYVNPEGSGRLQLFDANKQATSLWVSIKPFVHKTYSFKSYGASSGGTEYSAGTAAPTGNFKEFDGTEYMQIVVLTNPGEASWVGKTFYVPTNAETNGNARTQLHKANGDAVNVWVSIEP